MFGLFVFVCCVILDIVIFYNVADNNEYKANFIVEIISIGFTAGIFELIVNYLPLRKKDRISRQITVKNLNCIISCMEHIIYITLKIFNVNKNVKEIASIKISKQDCLNGKIDYLGNKLNHNIQHIDDKFIIDTTIYDNTKKRKNTVINRVRSDLKSYSNYIKWVIGLIERDINEIKKFEYFYSHDIVFVKLISELSVCDFISIYKKKQDFDLKCFSVSDTEKMFVEFVKIYDNLSRLNYHTEYTKINLIIGKDAENYWNQQPKYMMKKLNLE